MTEGVAVVTGGASGIGAALAERMRRDGMRVATFDRRGGDVDVDVTDEVAVAGAIRGVEEQHGPIGVYCSNAGVAAGHGLGDDADWAQSWALHGMAHVYAARCVLPGMAERGGGHFVVTASAAGLLMTLQSAPYTVTKHASVAIAEWLAVAYGDRVGIHCLAPQGVRTPMVAAGDERSHRELQAAGPILEPEEVADAVVAALGSGEFLVTPHTVVRDYEARKVADRDRWLGGMRRLRARL
ncbi:MAG: SDR family oxidoreductase [Acidimicrobiales bacterium]